MKILIWLRRRRSTVSDPQQLDAARQQVEQLEARASYVVPQVVEHGERNNFAERLRGTLARPNGA